MILPEINIDGKQISSIFITKTPDMIGNQPLKININSLILIIFEIYVKEEFRVEPWQHLKFLTINNGVFVTKYLILLINIRI